MRTRFVAYNFLENFIGHKKNTDEDVHGQQKCHSYDELTMSFLVPFNVVNFACSLVVFQVCPFVARGTFIIFST